MSLTIALAGNPNCGKTTLFNALTGTYQKVGNWTGVTTEIKRGVYKKDKRINVVDLPGLYSFSASAIDERTAYKYLKGSPPDVIINVVDGTNLERNLSLTIELLALKIPTVIAVNMYDELEKNGIKLNVGKLSALFGVPVIPISALKNKNIEVLIKTAESTRLKPEVPDINKETGESAAEKRFSFIEKHIDGIIEKRPTKAEIFTQKADAILLNKYLGLPVFFLVMTLVYFLSYKLGGYLGEYLSSVFYSFGNGLRVKLQGAGVYEWLISLLCDAIIGSLGGVVSFLPQILVLFALMAVIEESGYAARVAFLLDRFFYSFGLGGKSLLPMIVSCGCTVTGLMATRTIERVNERRMTIFLSPFMPCGAKTAVFAWFSSAFFGGNALVSASMYFLGILCAAIFGKILKKFKVFNECGGSFIMEIPTLRLPSLKDVLYVLFEKVKEFTTKAGFIVFAVSVFLWLLKSVGISGYVGADIQKSFLFNIGNAIKYLFYPIGVSGWEGSVAIISGLFAKEAVVETLTLIATDINTVFYDKYSVYAFMAFILLSPPCVASLAAAKQELKSIKWFLFMIVFQTVAAYAVAVIINLIGFAFTAFKGLLLSLFIAIIIVTAIIFAIKRLKSSKCKMCKACILGEKCQKGKRYTT